MLNAMPDMGRPASYAVGRCSTGGWDRGVPVSIRAPTPHCAARSVTLTKPSARITPRLAASVNGFTTHGNATSSTSDVERHRAKPRAREVGFPQSDPGQHLVAGDAYRLGRADGQCQGTSGQRGNEGRSIADGHHRVDRPDDRPNRPVLVMLVTAIGGEDELRVSDGNRPPLASSTY